MRRVPDPEASRASSSSSLSWRRPGWGCRSSARGPGVLAQHAEQPPHLGQRGPRGVADRGQPLRPGGGHPGGGQPGRLRLHGDHGDVVGDNVVQLAGDAGAFPAGHVLDQRAGDDLPGSAVLRSLAAGPPRGPGPAPPPGPARPASTAGDPGPQGRPAPAPGTAAPAPRPAAVTRCRPSRYNSTSCATRPGDGQRVKGRERQHARGTDRHRGRRRVCPQQPERQRGEQREQHEGDLQIPAARPAIARGVGDRLGRPRPRLAAFRPRRARAGPWPAAAAPRPSRRASHLPGPRQPLSSLAAASASPAAGIPPSLARGMRQGRCPSRQRRRRRLAGVTTAPANGFLPWLAWKQPSKSAACASGSGPRWHWTG